jgi:hypothetical protein
LDALQRFQRPDEHRRWIPLPLGDDVEAVMEAIDQVDV